MSASSAPAVGAAAAAAPVSAPASVASAPAFALKSPGVSGPSPAAVRAQWNMALENGLVKTVYGLGAGVIAGYALFRT